MSTDERLPEKVERALEDLFEQVHSFARAGGYYATLHPNDYRPEMDAVRHAIQVALLRARAQERDNTCGDHRHGSVCDRCCRLSDSLRSQADALGRKDAR